jgi:hypothetical protein
VFAMTPPLLREKFYAVAVTGQTATREGQPRLAPNGARTWGTLRLVLPYR